MPIDLDAILDIVDGYEARKKSAREWHIKNDVPADEDHLSRLATFNTDETFKAFEALRPLVERVRELERQREFFLKALNDNRLCPNGGCFHDGSDLDEWDCTATDNRECWIQASKKEAGE